MRPGEITSANLSLDTFSRGGSFGGRGGSCAISWGACPDVLGGGALWAGRQRARGSASGGWRDEGVVGRIDAGIGADMRLVSGMRRAVRMLGRVRRWRTKVFIAAESDFR